MLIELILFLVALVVVLHVKKKQSLPPGPFSLPIIGTLFTNGIDLSSEAYHKYGDLCSFLVGPSTVFVMINDFHLSRELFSKDEFSGRVKNWWLQNVRGINGQNLGIMDTEGQIWSHQRRFALKELRDLGFGKKSLDSVMVEEVDEVIDQLLQSKDGIARMDGTFNTAIINVLWQMVASKRFEPDTPETKYMMTQLILSVGPPSPIQFIDFLCKSLPFSKKDNSYFEMKKMMRGLITEHLLDIDYDNPRDFIDVYLREMRQNKNFTFDHLVLICLDFFQAGAETTSTTLWWSVFYMALYPDVQEKCRKEMDEHLGSRQPTVDDMSSLPYIMATIMEISRMARVLPVPIPHLLLQDTQVRDYRFQKGTMFLTNLSKFMMDPTAFPEPQKFKPERFLGEDGKLVKNDKLVPFGIGKRYCMGESLAKNELFIFFVRFFQRLLIEQSEKLDPEKVVVGITRLPVPFNVKVVNRSS